MKQANPHEKQGGPNMYSNPMNPMMYQQQGEKTFICMPHLLLLIIPTCTTVVMKLCSWAASHILFVYVPASNITC